MQTDDRKSYRIRREGKTELKTKTGYGMGDIYGGGAFVIIGTYYLYLLTDVLRISTALTGAVIMISKI